MKKVFFSVAVILLLFSEVSLGASRNSSLSGQVWEYADYIYRQERRPRPNLALHVRFEFNTDSLMNLSWFRDNEDTYCHRTAEYTWIQNIIHQKIIWVDPRNSIECGLDPDMQLGRESDNVLEMVGNELFLHLELGGEDFIYVLKRIE